MLERRYIDAYLPEYNMDVRTRTLRGDWEKTSPPYTPISDNPWAGITPEQWAATLGNVDDTYLRQKEWMRRLRAMKADRSVRMEDFGISPFDPEWDLPEEIA